MPRFWGSLYVCTWCPHCTAVRAAPVVKAASLIITALKQRSETCTLPYCTLKITTAAAAIVTHRKNLKKSRRLAEAQSTRVSAFATWTTICDKRKRWAEVVKMKRNGDLAAAVCFLCVGVSACLLPQLAGAVGSTWHPNPTRRGHYDSAAHQHGVSPLSAPAPTAGADLPSLPPSRAPQQARPHFGISLQPPPSSAPEQARPHFGFPLQPTVGFPSPHAGAPSAGEGYPFIGSNPTVPLPTGMTDSSTVLPLPDRGSGDGKVVGRAAPALARVRITMIGFLLIFPVLFLLWS